MRLGAKSTGIQKTNASVPVRALSHTARRTNHSAFSAIIGSTRLAPRAGIQHARKAIREEHHRDPGEGDRVGGADAVEEALQQVGTGEGERQADERADRRQPHAVADDELLHVGQLGAERHAQTDLAGAAGDDARRKERQAHVLGERFRAEDRQRGIELLHGVAQRIQRGRESLARLCTKICAGIRWILLTTAGSQILLDPQAFSLLGTANAWP